MNKMEKSKFKIKAIESVPLIYGSMTSGAKGRYIIKENMPKLQTLIEGGYAKDIYLKLDEKTERIEITDILIESEDKFIADMELAESYNMFGILECGNRTGVTAALTKIGKKNKAIFWCNGMWSIIEEHLQDTNDLYIPEELALNIINRANIGNKSKIIASLETIKFENEKFDSTSAKKLAQILGMSDLYSIWRYKENIMCMLNTDMAMGPYKLQRIYENVNIRISVRFEHEKSLLSGTQFYQLNDISINDDVDYETMIIDAFDMWSGYYVDNEYANFGNGDINVSVDVLKDTFENSANIHIVNIRYKDDNNAHISNVECGENWRLNQIGKMTLYNHYSISMNDINIEDISIDKNTYIRNAKHEFGHFLGLGDAYNGASNTKEVPPESIMWNGDIITSNDIEMVLMAVLKNQKQYFYSTETKEKSEAITY